MAELRLWRFVIVPAAKRALLADMLEAALPVRDAQTMAATRDKAHRAWLLMLAVAKPKPAQPDLPGPERLVPLGAALQNLLLAHAMGYGARLTSGPAMRSPRLHTLFRLQSGEEAVCFVSAGSVTQRKPMRPRPSPHEVASEL